jgi:ferredoxin--NADP+ reductase
MAHVVTQSCVGDGACVYACPVNCIQPTPDDPAFETTEILHIDPATCVDCGACVMACPVDAIKPHTKLDSAEQAFLSINADYYNVPRARTPLAPVRPRLVVRDRGEPLRVAIVGSGPAAMYAADEILTIPGAAVSVFERLGVPYGLVRAGVAPDHRRTRRIARQFEAIRRHPGLQMHLGVEVGKHVTHGDLVRDHHAVIYAVGATADRRLQIPGATLAGVASASEFAGWYNGSAGHASRTFDLSHRRAVVIGNGNVALDIARILTSDAAALAASDISPRALAALRCSAIEEVIIVGRRGAAHSAFTLPELVGLAAAPHADLVVEPHELDDVPPGDPKIELLRGLRSSGGRNRQIKLRYRLEAVRVHGEDRVEAVEFADRAGHGSAAASEVIAAGLLVTAIGYRGTPPADLPFDEATATIPNERGRVIDSATGVVVPGTYVVGWIKRGARGFIGTNKICAQDTVETLVNDYNAGMLASPSRGPAARGFVSV